MDKKLFIVCYIDFELPKICGIYDEKDKAQKSLDSIYKTLGEKEWDFFKKYYVILETELNLDQHVEIPVIY